VIVHPILGDDGNLGIEPGSAFVLDDQGHIFVYQPGQLRPAEEPYDERESQP
jgi:hypothetical protein